MFNNFLHHKIRQDARKYSIHSSFVPSVAPGRAETSVSHQTKSKQNSIYLTLYTFSGNCMGSTFSEILPMSHNLIKVLLPLLDLPYLLTGKCTYPQRRDLQQKTLFYSKNFVLIKQILNCKTIISDV